MSESRSAERSASIHTSLSVSSHPLSRFATSSTQPALEELKLSNILNGDTCPPISFVDFASFVANKEFTTENLLFILWYRSYKSRFDKLDQKVKETIPIPSTRLGDRFDPYGYLDRPSSSSGPHTSGKVEQDVPVVFSEPFRSKSGSSKSAAIHTETAHQQNCSGSASSCSCIENRAPPCRRQSRLLSITQSILGSRRPSSASHAQENNPLRSILHHTSHPPLPPSGTVLAEPSQQPMREEAQRSFATFLRKGGSRELGISDELREYTRICLVRSTAPEVFLPLYEEIYHTVETQSLPHFLQHARSNINRPKQLFWYMIGAADFALGALIYLLLTLLLPAQPFGHRAWRLFSIIFASFGTMQAYSAYRGFCTQVWGRSHRQVRPWEMDDLDDEEELVEAAGRDDMELKADAFNSESTPTPTITRREIHISLPEEVRPLADLGGVASIPSSEEGDELLLKQDGSPALSKSDSITVALPVLDERPEEIQLTEAERRRQEIRRSTIKVPNASEAFPITDDMMPPPPPQPQGRISFDSKRQRREISPFVNGNGFGNGDDDGPILPSSASSMRGSINFANSNSNANTGASAGGGVPLTRTKSRLHSLTNQRATKEISNILLRLRKSNFNDDYEEGATPSSGGGVGGGGLLGGGGPGGCINSFDPLVGSGGRSIRESRTLAKSNLKGKGKGKEKRTKVFGPEKLVEDPRIKRVYRDIKRDILIVGGIVAALWIILCLAVPCAGLASKK
ncbi:uncharacterized protein I303_102727 [Kwoniella dejecticola CBS 10117]|uniref:RGS domain-containing protein n=1 Tax=Kwoniella dejecticola CBS 10117 TaxID=1296121 RepID=A0A1A6A9K2_9TREE|nr:uncharacterized protein I303_02742 [Kwoniella dejecticola CBS 10117]OBR86729.1 hypothetical protein I303_02742 [Kwoniella dejecticola CBS 10117]